MCNKKNPTKQLEKRTHGKRIQINTKVKIEVIKLIYKTINYTFEQNKAKR